jgi:hypothetical protein
MGTDIPKAITRGNRMSLNAMSFGNNYAHGTVTTITGQRDKNHSRGSSEEPLANYPGKIGRTFYVETEQSSIGPGPENERVSDDPYYPGRV